MGPDDTTRTLHCTAGPEALDRVHDLIDEVFGACPMPDEIRIRLESAIGEVAANIVEHAVATTRLLLTITVDRKKIVATMIDDGEPLEPAVMRTEMPDVLAERGRGLPIASAVLDRLDYYRHDNQNHWVLLIKRSE